MKKISEIGSNISLTIKSAFYILEITYKSSPLFIWLQILMIGVNTVEPIIAAYLTKLLLDELTDKRDTHMLVTTVGCIIVLAAISKLVRIIIERFIVSRSIWVNNEFSMLLHRKSASMDYEFTESREVQDKRKIAENGFARTGGVSSYIQTISSVVGAIITLCSISVLFVNINILVPLLIVLLRLISAYFKGRQKKHDFNFDEENDRLNNVYSYTWMMTHNEQAAKDSRVYDLKPLYRKKMEGFQEESYRISITAARKNYFYTAILGLFHHTYLMIAYLVLVYQAFAVPAFTIGSLSMALSLAGQFDNALGSIIDGTLKLFYNGKYIEEFRAFTDMPDRMPKDGKEHIPARSENYTFVFENVSFRYPGNEKYTLKNVTFEISAGQKTALVGENGSGKSTIIKLLCRLYDPTDGRILLDGRDIREYSYEEYLNAFSVVFQDYDIVPFTIRENVNISTVPEKADERVTVSLEMAGLGERITKTEKGELTYAGTVFDKSGMNFSGGEKQKLSIARAFYKNAPVMILDEPTAALDPRSEFEIFKMFRDKVKEKTAVLISHRLSSCRICDRILVFKDGRLVQIGKHDDLVNTNGLYNELWKSQAGYYI